MRTFIVTAAIVFGVLAIPAAPAGIAGSGAPAIGAAAVLHADSFAPQGDRPIINVEVNKPASGGGRWYANPVWIAIGVIAAVLVIFLIAMAVRGGGGGATVVKG